MNLLRIFIVLLLSLFSVWEGMAQFYNGTDQSYGKNRVQYQEFFWQYYRYPDFNTYFYKGGDEVAAYVSERAYEIIPLMEEQFEFVLDDKIQFIVYKSFSDFKQTNIGLSQELNSNIGGTTQLIGNKVFLFYEGTHRDLEEQLFSGISHVIVNQLLFGGSLKDMLQSSTFLSLPEWYIDGVVAYMGRGWDIEVDNFARDGFISGRFNKYHHLEGHDAEVAGHALWNYVAEVYGERVIPGILHMTRLSRNIESGFLYILGLDLDHLLSEVRQFYLDRYEQEEVYRMAPEIDRLDIRTKKRRTYTQFALSPDGFRAAYVSNELGQYRIYVYETETGKRKKIEKGSHKLDRITDYSYPVITWHPGSDVLAYITEAKGKVWLNLYAVSDNSTTTRELFGLDKVLSMTYMPDGKNMVFSAVVGGQTDLYKYYTTGNRVEKITDDVYDDLHPSFSSEESIILFSSNRPDSSYTTFREPHNATFDLFELHLDKQQGTTGRLKRITRTEEANETHPFDYGNKRYTYVSDESGVVNRYYARYDSAVTSVDTTINYRYFSSSYPLSNYRRSILDYDVQYESGKYGVLLYEDGAYRFYIGNLDDDEIVSLSELKKAGLTSIQRINFDQLDSTQFGGKAGGRNEEIAREGRREAYKIPSEPEPDRIDIRDYRFIDDEGQARPEQQEKKKEKQQSNPSKQYPLLEEKKQGFELGEQRNYRLNFTTDYVQTQIDNQNINGFYQVLFGPDNSNPGLSVMPALGVTDLFEDYKIEGGIRVSVNLQNSDYYLKYKDLSGRVDKTASVFRQSNRVLDPLGVVQITTHTGSYRLKYPFNEVSAVAVTPTYIHERFVSLSTDSRTLNRESLTENHGGLKVEYIFDNTLPLGLNLYQGARVKVFAEMYRKLDEGDKNLQVFGFDARHYTRIHRSLIWANRLSGAASFGSRRVLFMMGGVNRWLYLPRSEDGTPFPEDLAQNYGYQAIIPPVRGFNKNVRNGNQFILLNSELRLPVFKYLANRPIKSEFLETFQLLGFADVGTAWTGASPYSDDNQINIKTIPGNPITVRFKNRREPFVGGVGFGMHAKLMGYFIRADWAWGIENQQLGDRQFYISLSLDF